MSERIDIVDENGEPTGETVDRVYAHLNGIWHRTSHLWLIREKDGCIQILLQKRSKNKDSYPNCYDISSAGHIPAGIDYKPSAIRELKEELGIDANEKDLIFCGDRKIILDDSFHGKEFHDRQHSRVFMMWCNLSVDKFMICEDEVESICWMNFDSCYEGVKNNLFLNCIAIEELEMLRKSFVS